MKYIILASLLASAAVAAPAPNKKGGNNNANQAGAGAASVQSQQSGASGNAGATGNANTGAAAGAAGSAAPPPPGGAPGQTPNAADLATAVANWQADTMMVSAFLNNGNSINDDDAFKLAATVAFNAEVDELTHKAVIDAANGNDPNVQAANSTLATGGAFQDVVDKLQIMSQQGKAAANNIDLILQNRCTNVLPNIDAYMASTGSNLQAIRPNACDSTGVIGGVQSNGPTLPGQTPGTPQQAFDAAAALAAGTGNGRMAQSNTGSAANAGAQNGNAQNNGAQGNGAQGNGAQSNGAQKGAQKGGAQAQGNGSQSQNSGAQASGANAAAAPNAAGANAGLSAGAA